MNAIIYVRVSTKEQADTGHSLKAQEKECRAFAADMGYAVLQVFVEEGESAKTTDRTQLTLMWEYISKNHDRIDALILWDIDRISRSPRDYYEIEAKLKAKEIQMLSVKGSNDISPIGNLVRSISVSLSAFENDQKKQRVDAAMKHALEQGLWLWRAPIGYKREKVEHGKSKLVPDEQKSPFIIEAFTLMAKGTISQREIFKRLVKKGFKITYQNLNKILHNPIYYGMLRTKYFPNNWPKGNHEPIIPESLFLKVQEILKTGEPKRIYGRISRRYPLHLFIQCTRCGKKMQGHDSTGNGGLYHLYSCYTKGCIGSKSQKIMEKKFTDLLSLLQPSEGIIKLFLAVVQDTWETAKKYSIKRVEELQNKAVTIKEQKSAMMKKLAAGIIEDTEYQQYTEETRTELFKVEEEIATLSKRNADDLSECLSYAKYCIANIQELWMQASLDDKSTLQSTVFPEALTFDGEKLLNRNISLLFSKLQEIRQIPSKWTNKRLLNRATSLQDNKIPALSGRASSNVPPRGIEPLFPP